MRCILCAQSTLPAPAVIAHHTNNPKLKSVSAQKKGMIFSHVDQQLAIYNTRDDYVNQCS